MHDYVRKFRLLIITIKKKKKKKTIYWPWDVILIIGIDLITTANISWYLSCSSVSFGLR
jgi:hypothetical protein